MDGTIYRISGPVVTAKGLAAPKMYDVVRVGAAKLIGEIIKLDGEYAIIQVYEDTTGIRPGEPVETTNAQLSVTLGPGLIGSIYDGIQRPLDKIKASSGDFIARGVEAEPLDSKRKWHFVPLKSLKKGSEVRGGSAIGEVRETDLITHKVLVPPGISGKIESISEGDYTINDTVALVSTDSGVAEVKMSQKWPVRIPRPLKNKLPPEIPLITGQRVIDTFFPVAKGGTAAVPGPFGSGKCVTGDTPIMLGDGTIMEIEAVYKQKKESGRVIKLANEEYVELDSPVELVSLKDGKFTRSSSRLLYKGKSDSVLRLKTRTGREARITPVHKLFRITDRGGIIETEAKELRVGDFIAAVRKLDIKAQSETRLPKPLAPKKHHNDIKIPESITSDLAEFLGYYISEGCIRSNNTVIFTNSEEELLDRFAFLSKELFGLTGKKEYPKGKTPNVLLFSKMLVDFLDLLSCGGSASEKRIPSAVLKCDNRILSAFLTSYFIGDGSFYDGDIEFTTASKLLQLQLSYVLSRFGIMHSLSVRTIKGTPYYRIFVRGIDNLKLLVETLNPWHKKVAAIKTYIESKHSKYNSIDIVPLSSEYVEELYRNYGKYSKLLENGIEISNYVGNKERMGTGTFRKFISAIDIPVGGQIQKLAVNSLSEMLDYIYCDEIVSIKEEMGPFDVYDFSVPEYGSNFVGGFGGLVLHNTVIQQQLAKWSDADVIVYVGCGERGNEMTEVLTTFPELKDPKSGKPLMDRTVLIANTSNMPVAAREASIYTGITIAEYYRDMGYSVALMADSTSRWAEALREISGRLEEMPGEEGYPAYLGRKIAEFYERAGRVETLGGATGSVTAIGAVSPPGGDTSEPVSQNTLRVTRVFWALDAALANARHFPSINWLTSYSLYSDDLKEWYGKNVNKEWTELNTEAMKTLQLEAEINEIVQLVGYDALPESNKATLDIAKSIREDYLQQSAFDEIDTYSSMKKQYLMLKAIVTMGAKEYDAVKRGVPMEMLSDFGAKQKIAKMKFVKEEDIEKYADDVIKSLGEIDEIKAATK